METEFYFRTRLSEAIQGGYVALSVGLGYHLGLFDALAQQEEPVTSQQLADLKNYKERYVREWLGAVATGDVVAVTQDDPPRFYVPEHRVSVLRELGAAAYDLGTIGDVFHLVQECFPKDGPPGVPFSRFPGMADSLYYARQNLTTEGVYHYCKAMPGIREKLEAGISVLDAGCSVGVVTRVYARTFPRSSFTACDVDAAALARARRDSADLLNITYTERDICDPPPDWLGKYDLVIAHDVIHDLPRPADALKVIHSVLKEDGVFFMLDISADSRLQGNLGREDAPTLYTFSLFHCMTVSLAEGGAGLGACWGHQEARRLLLEADFSQVDYQRELDVGWSALWAAYK